MRLLGFTFEKISIEKFSSNTKDLKINTKIDLPEIKKTQTKDFSLKEELIGAKFALEIDYSPDFAKIEFKGNMLLALEPKTAKEILKKWEEKQMPEDFRNFLFNVIYRKAGVKALELEEEMNLPFHIQFPVAKISQDSQ